MVGKYWDTDNDFVMIADVSIGKKQNVKIITNPKKSNVGQLSLQDALKHTLRYRILGANFKGV